MLLFLLIFFKTLRNRLWLMQKNLKEIKCHICKRDYFKSLVVGWNQFRFVVKQWKNCLQNLLIS
jgi:hypothetical protein